MDESITLITTIRERHRQRGYIAFIKKLGRDSHEFTLGVSAIADFHAGYDEAEAQYKSWRKARFATAQVAA